MNIIDKYFDETFELFYVEQNPYNKYYSITLKEHRWPTLTVDSIVATKLGFDNVKQYGLIAMVFQGFFIDDEIIWERKENAINFLKLYGKKG